MTTIAYHHGDKQIAIDSRTTSGDEILTDKANKTIKNKTGLWFFSGSNCTFKDFSAMKHNDEVSPNPNCAALLIKDNKVYAVQVNHDGYCCYTELTYNYTLGSGGEYATGAMDHGKSAPEAVKYAMTRDSNSGGRVRVHNLR